MAMVIARARIANSGNWNAIEVRFCDDKNLSGDITDIRPKTQTAINSSRNSGADVKCFMNVCSVMLLSSCACGGSLSPVGGNTRSQQDQQADRNRLPCRRNTDDYQAVLDDDDKSYAEERTGQGAIPAD